VQSRQVVTAQIGEAKMKQRWQWEHEALELLRFTATYGNADRERAVEVVIQLLQEIEKLKKEKLR
jgi:hypothetical protein